MSAPIAANAPVAPPTVAATTHSDTAVALDGKTRKGSRARRGGWPCSGSGGRSSMSSSTVLRTLMQRAHETTSAPPHRFLARVRLRLVRTSGDGFRHEAMFYAGEREFLDGTVPF